MALSRHAAASLARLCARARPQRSLAEAAIGGRLTTSASTSSASSPFDLFRRSRLLSATSPTTTRRPFSSSSSQWPPPSKIPRWWGDEGDDGSRDRRPGPRPAKLSALPFAVSRAEAERTYEAYHAAHALLPSRPPKPLRVDEAFLPFWAVAAVGRATLRGATVGFDRMERVYDPISKVWRSELRTRWHSVKLDRSWFVEYLPDAEGMTVYASFRYAPSDADAASPARAVGAATATGIPVSEAVSRPSPPDPEGRGASEGGSLARRAVDPFEMPPSEAARLAVAAARSSEASRAAAALRHEFRADRVAAVDLLFDPVADGTGGVAASPVYAPAFVFVWDHYGVRVPTVVSGSCRGSVAGDRALDAARVAAAAAAASVVAMAAAGGPPSWLVGGGAAAGGIFGGVGAGATALGWALGLAGPAAAAALAAHYAPLLRSRWEARAAGRASARSEEAARREGWDAEWVRGGGASEAADAARRRGGRQWEYKRNVSGDEPHRPGPAGDPRRYYSTLGVPPSASQREISAAFRGAALRAHPDRLPPEATEEERARATKGFREIMEAYSVLRDPEKRRRYDDGRL